LFWPSTIKTGSGGPAAGTVPAASAAALGRDEAHAMSNMLATSIHVPPVVGVASADRVSSCLMIVVSGSHYVMVMSLKNPRLEADSIVPQQFRHGCLEE
jgi:hypothetical protein